MSFGYFCIESTKNALLPIRFPIDGCDCASTFCGMMLTHIVDLSGFPFLETFSFEGRFIGNIHFNSIPFLETNWVTQDTEKDIAKLLETLTGSFVH